MRTAIVFIVDHGNHLQLGKDEKREIALDLANKLIPNYLFDDAVVSASIHDISDPQ